ncbi:glycoside hydrolase family 16 protein [Paxillus ammoniavirescens]|nr:glycoside hydrolase family 16 protein [Paxillus ammoniavirescens]
MNLWNSFSRSFASRFLHLAALSYFLIPSALCTTYNRTSSLAAYQFLDAFTWQTIADPVHGRVNYVNYSTAQQDSLVSVHGDRVVLRADSTTTLDPTGPGRNSFRLVSNERYTTHVAIFDIVHMPQGCGTWPAISEIDDTSSTAGGKIDIIEGVNDQTPNLSSLHTSANCTMPDSRVMTGEVQGDDCSSGSGCGVDIDDPASYGPPFNTMDGGWYAVERTATYISIFFWERDDASVPRQVSHPGQTVNPSTWGIPAAYFPNTECDFTTHFAPHHIMISLTFCGDWAGSNATYSASGCPSTCVDFVNQNPSAFSGAYFEFNRLSIYQ